ncbi:Coiled-coil domain-containing protein [Zancudomyces culisetae]|uniref:Coiled-coil domain-containing protein n=1 Tax=Zancudomyces culisetae TaxID=1213189 RepID=A0A1R1PML1_ZANCU|nr:Coiled-coil domain-containing protein [Zancudomyces culisetae]|eukprot:OMH82201.1 Coiled-coil domain-containing protein [Zancudomyces culisetae]
MPKKFKGENSKVTAAKEKKAANQKIKDVKKTEELERSEARKWSTGAKDISKKEVEQAKKLERLNKKKEAEDLLRKEESELAKSTVKRPPPKLTPKTASAISRGDNKKALKKEQEIHTAALDHKPVESFAASGIDDALDLLDVVNVSASSTSTKGPSSSNTLIDRHPERRHKAALKMFEERELPRIREEYKGLKLQQHKQILWKEWQKSPENPFNQSNLNYNATQEEIGKLLEEHTDSIKDRLRIE